MDILLQLIINSIIAGAVYALMALGFNSIYGVTKFFNVAHGAMTAIGGYAFFYWGRTLGWNIYLAAFYWGRTLGWNIYLAAMIGIALAGFAGYGLDKLAYAPLRKRKASPMVLLVASLGAFTALQAIIAMLFSSQFRILNGTTPKIYEFAGGTITQTQIVILLCVLGITSGMALVMQKTTFGKAMRAISDDEEVAKIIGIDTDKMIGYTFFIGSAIAGLAGILVGLDTGIEPTMGLFLLLAGIIASIVGGIGNLYGGVIGALILGFAENFGILWIAAEWKSAIAFSLLILFLLFRPQGIMKR